MVGRGREERCLCGRTTYSNLSKPKIWCVVRMMPVCLLGCRSDETDEQKKKKKNLPGVGLIQNQRCPGPGTLPSRLLEHTHKTHLALVNVRVLVHLAHTLLELFARSSGIYLLLSVDGKKEREERMRKISCCVDERGRPLLRKIYIYIQSIPSGAGPAASPERHRPYTCSTGGAVLQLCG